MKSEQNKNTTSPAIHGLNLSTFLACTLVFGFSLIVFHQANAGYYEPASYYSRCCGIEYTYKYETAMEMSPATLCPILEAHYDMTALKGEPWPAGSECHSDNSTVISNYFEVTFNNISTNPVHPDGFYNGISGAVFFFQPGEICTDPNDKWNQENQECECKPHHERDPESGQCEPVIDDLKNAGSCEHNVCPVGNPINQGTGNKFQRETDFTGVGTFALTFTRYYNSDASVLTTSVGEHWRDNYDRSITFPDATTTKLYHADGKVYQFTLNESNWLSDPDVIDHLEELIDGQGTTTGWNYTTADDTNEEYDTNGRLLTITNRVGFTQTLDYDVASANGGDDNPDTLDKVTGPYGRTLSFTYIAGRVDTMTDPAGEVYRYAYNANGNLESVAYPDETPADPSDNPQRIYHYEDNNFSNALTGITDETGNRFATWTYDTQGRAISSKHANGTERVDITYNTDSTTDVTDSFGHAKTYNFEILHGVVKTRQIDSGTCSECGQTQNVNYDANGFVTSRTDAKGNQTKLENNNRGLVECRIEAWGEVETRMTKTVWDTSYRLHTGISIYAPPEGTLADDPILSPADCGTAETNWVQLKQTDMTYINGQLETQTETDSITTESRSTTNSYYQTSDGFPALIGLLKSVDGPRIDVSDVTTYIYDEVTGVLERIEEAIQTPEHTTQITDYDVHGRPKTIIDPNLVATTLVYHPRGWLLTRTVAGETTEYRYYNTGQLKDILSPNGATLHYDYDAAQRLSDITNNQGNTIHYGLDTMGNRILEQTSDGTNVTRQLKREYDVLNRLELNIGGAEQITRYAYDANGNQTATFDPRQTGNDTIAAKLLDPNTTDNTTITGYDALNRLISSVNLQVEVDSNDNITTEYEYDALDNLSKVIDPEGLETSYTYNALGDLKKLVSPDTGTTDYTYDEAGNRKTQTDNRGVQVAYAYDALNRLTNIRYPDNLPGTDNSQNVTFVYDTCINGIGRLCQMTDESGTTTYSYDAKGNLDYKSITIDGLTQSMGYDYNGADQLIQITYPSGRTVDYIRNTLGQINSVTTTFDGTTEILAEEGIEYAPFGPITSFTYGNGIVMQRLLDSDYRIESLKHGTVYDVTYDLYDEANNIETILNNLNPAKDQTLAYDGMNRLDTAESPVYGFIGYDYDTNGNRLIKRGDSQLEIYSYVDPTDLTTRRLQQTDDGVIKDYDYDEVGNTTSNTDYDFAYGDNNRLQEVQVNGIPQATYTYNGRGERVKKVATETTIYVYDENGQLIAELDEQGDTQKEYIYIDGQPLALIRAGASSSDSITTLFSDSFTGTDGQVIDDQPDESWRGKRPKRGTSSAEIRDNRAYILPGERISSEATFVNNGQDTLIAKVDILSAGKMVLKNVNTPKTGIRIKFRPNKNKAVVKIGRFDNPLGKQVIDLSVQPTISLHAEIRLRGDSAQVILTDEHGNIFDTGIVQSKFLSAGDEYRLKLATAQENSVKVTAVMDNVVVLREINTPPANMAAIFYYHPDHLGTPRVMTGKNQQVVWQADYTPFGEANITTETITNNLRFPGQYYDEETGLHYNYFRDYDPSTGRYIQPDPIGMRAGTNLNSYVKSNPITNFDPLGLATCGSGGNEPYVPDNPMGFPFSACCQIHDSCYGTCGKTKYQCDINFLSCMEEGCNFTTSSFIYARCMQVAEGYYSAVVNEGQEPYDNAQRNACATPPCKEED